MQVLNSMQLKMADGVEDMDIMAAVVDSFSSFRTSHKISLSLTMQLDQLLGILIGPNFFFGRDEF